MHRHLLSVAVVLFLIAAGCETHDHKPKHEPRAEQKLDQNPVQKSLYERLGGEPAIRAVVDDFVARGAANPKVNFARKGTSNEWKPTDENIKVLKERLVEFIGMNTGGPQKYKGEDMVTSHKGMKITEAEFDALATDLKASLDKLKVPQKEQDELLKIVGGTKQAIVNK